MDKPWCVVIKMPDTYSIHNEYDGCSIYNKEDEKIKDYVQFLEQADIDKNSSVSQTIISYMKNSNELFECEYPDDEDVHDLRCNIDRKGISYIYELAVHKSSEYAQDQCGKLSIYWHKIARLIPILYGSVLEEDTLKLIRDLINEVDNNILCVHVKEKDAYEKLLSKIKIGQI